MPYSKPGVTVKQVQTTSSPNLATPSIYTAITGEAFNIVEMDDQTYATTYDKDNDTDVVLTGMMGASDGSDIIGNSVVVQLYSLTAGYKHLNSIVDTTFVTVANKTVTILNPGSALDDWHGATIKVWYREENTNADSFVFKCNGIDDITAQYGPVHPWNPIGYGLNIAMSNAGSSVYGIAVDDDNDADHTAALQLLEGQDVYSLAPMTQATATLDNYPDHCQSMSSEANKRERICFLSPKTTWTAGDGSTATHYSAGATPASDNVNLDKTAEAEADNIVEKDKRVYSVFPDMGYVSMTIPMGMLDKGWFTDGTNVIWNNTGIVTINWKTSAEAAGDPDAYIYFDGTQVFDGVTYYGDTKVTAARMAALKASTTATHVNVLMPVPGYYMAAANAGLVSAKSPSAGHTNSSVSGTNRTWGGADIFSQSRLDTVAAGGRFIMEQTGISSPINIRHQMSTDRTSVESQELSVVKAIDYVSKYVRDGVKPYIGSFNITASFLKLVKTVLNAQGAFLRTEGVLDDFKVVKVEQNPSQKDQVLVEISVLVQYPVNYIKISLQF